MTGRTGHVTGVPGIRNDAAMEPGRDDREDPAVCLARCGRVPGPQWSPVVMTGRTRPEGAALEVVGAAMEPGRDDREDALEPVLALHRPTPQWSPVVMTGRTVAIVGESTLMFVPQWSPVVMTGRTGSDAGTLRRRGDPAAMEPGRDDREDYPADGVTSSPEK